MTRRTAVAATALVLLGAGLSTASAAPDGPGTPPSSDERPRAVTVRGDCGPSGRVVLRQVTTGDRTTVTVKARGVENGRWRGEHLVEVGVDDTDDTRVAIRARKHAFTVQFAVEGAAVGGVLDLTGPRGAGCHASYSEAGSMVVVTDAWLAAMVRRSGPTKLVARLDVGCHAGQRWSAELSFADDESGAGIGAPRVPCRHGFATLREAVERDPATLPRTVELSAQRPGGRRLRVSYVASEPAPIGTPS